jgi:hypothetical protein
MFGVDLGISVSSITCVTSENKVLDYKIIFGDKTNEDDWVRIVNMMEVIVKIISEIPLAHNNIIIEPKVSIEEPVFPYRTRNPKSYFNMCCLYGLLRHKLTVRKYDVYSIHPLSAKSTAKRLAFGSKKLKKLLANRGTLTKKGMIRAFTKVLGYKPPYSNNIGRETLADSYFIARTGLDRLRIGVQ